jgi:lipopolysaccharide transport system permease protein
MTDSGYYVKNALRPHNPPRELLRLMERNKPTAAASWVAPFDGISPLLRHRALLWQFTERNVELRHKGSHLGLIWSFLNPLLMLGLYVFVFGFVFGGKFNATSTESRVDYALGIFVGLSIFHFVGEVLGVAPTVIVGNPNFVKKVVFPLEILPVASVGASFVHCLISVLLALLGIAFAGPGPSLGMLWMPVILVPVLLLALGIAWFCSALGVFFRDINQLTAFLSMALMFASAVFYPASKIPPSAWAILRFNPLIHAIELSRNAVLWHTELNYHHLGYLYAVSLLAATAGYWTFHKLRPAFADVL